MGLRRNEGFRNFDSGKIYSEEGSNFEHRLRGLLLDSLEENGRAPSYKELEGRINENKRDDIEDEKERAGIYVEPIVLEGGYGVMSSERENEVFDFWVTEYLEEDWNQYHEADVDTVMKLRMTQENISEYELNAIADEYSDWVDFGHFSN